MKYTLFLLMFSHVLSYGQQRKELVSMDDYSKLENKLNDYIKNNNVSNTFKGVGFGMMGVGLISLYSISQDEVTLDTNLEKRQDKIGNNLLVAALGGFISCLGVVISTKDTNVIIQDISPNTSELNINSGSIKYKRVRAIFREKDKVAIKTVNGPVEIEGLLQKIAVNRVEVDVNGQLFLFYYNQIESMKLLSE